MKNIRFPWWASPSTLLVISLLVVFYAIVFVDDEQYNIWKTPRYVTHVEAVEVGSVIVAVLLGIVVAASISQRNNENYVADTAKFLKSRQLNTLFYIFTVLTIIGYSIWIIKAFHSGLTGAEVLATIKGDPGAVSQLKGTAQPTAGLTTLTQFGSLVVVLGILRDRLAEKNSKLIVWLVLFLSVLRFVFYAERIAFLEVAVPAVILAASLWPTKVRWPSARKWITNILPIVLGLFVFILFAVGEYSRSWAVLRTQTSQTYTEFIISRFLSYYATATNNGVLYGRLADANNLDHTAFYAFYNLPGSFFGTDAVSGTNFDQWWGMQLELFANPSLTNTGTIFPLIGELSLATVLILFFAVGYISTVLFRQAKNGHLISMMAVPILCYAFVELPRISYLTLGRSVPIFLGILIMWFVFDLWKTTERYTLKEQQQ